MILYDNRDTKKIILRRTGSVLFSFAVMAPAIMSTTLCTVMLLLPEARIHAHISVSVARIYATILGFVIVMRTTMSFGRFFQGIDEVTMMFSKWRDAGVSLLAFADVAIDEMRVSGEAESLQEIQDCKARLLHWFTLLCALAVQRIQEPSSNEEQEDGELSGDMTDRPFAAQLDFRFREDPRNNFFREDVVGSAALAEENSNAEAGIEHSEASSQAPPMPSEITLPTSVKRGRAAQAGRDGDCVGLSSTSCRGMMGRLKAANMEEGSEGGLRAHPLRSLGSYGNLSSLGSEAGMSSAGMRSFGAGGHSSADPSRRNSLSSHGSIFSSFSRRTGGRDRGSRPGFLGMIKPSTWDESFGNALAQSDNRPQVVGKLTDTESIALSRSSDMALTVTKWILWEMSHQSIARRLTIPPPILSRIYQEMSNGMLGCAMATKITDVPFPFPFAQVLQWALYAFMFVCPLVVAHDVDKDDTDGGIRLHWMSLVINFFACVGYGALNMISVELEEPFGEDPNDYPVHIQQWSIVQSLIDAYFQGLPRDFGMQFFGDSFRPFKTEVDRIMEQGRNKKRHGDPDPKPSPEQAKQDKSQEELVEKFDEVHNALAASEVWFKRHVEDLQKPDLLADEGQFSHLVRALTAATSAGAVPVPAQAAAAASEAAAGSAGTGQPRDHRIAQAATRKTRMHRQAFLEVILGQNAVEVGQEGDKAPTGSSMLQRHASFASRGTDGEEDDQDEEYIDERMTSELEELISSAYDPAEGARLRRLLEQHAASAQLLQNVSISRRRRRSVVSFSN